MPADGGPLRQDTPGSGFAALDAMVRPRSVAIVGASDDPTRIGGRPIAYMRSQGFAGTILALVPLGDMAGYQAQMEKVFGQGCCYRFAVRPVGGVQIG